MPAAAGCTQAAGAARATASCSLLLCCAGGTRDGAAPAAQPPDHQPAHVCRGRTASARCGRYGRPVGCPPWTAVVSALDTALSRTVQPRTLRLSGRGPHTVDRLRSMPVRAGTAPRRRTPRPSPARQRGRYGRTADSTIGHPPGPADGIVDTAGRAVRRRRRVDRSGDRRGPAHPRARLRATLRRCDGADVQGWTVRDAADTTAVHCGHCVRVLGGPSARAASGGSQSLPWLPRRMVRHARGASMPPAVGAVVRCPAGADPPRYDRTAVLRPACGVPRHDGLCTAGSRSFRQRRKVLGVQRGGEWTDTDHRRTG